MSQGGRDTLEPVISKGGEPCRLAISSLTRVSTRHPDVSADSVRVAWSNVVRFMAREDTDPLRYVAVGYDEYGRLLEMVAVLDESDRWHVFHAMRATPKVLRELKLL